MERKLQGFENWEKNVDPPPPHPAVQKYIDSCLSFKRKIMLPILFSDPKSVSEYISKGTLSKKRENVWIFPKSGPLASPPTIRNHKQNVSCEGFLKPWIQSTIEMWEGRTWSTILSLLQAWQKPIYRFLIILIWF